MLYDWVKYRQTLRLFLMLKLQLSLKRKFSLLNIFWHRFLNPIKKNLFPPLFFFPSKPLVGLYTVTIWDYGVDSVEIENSNAVGVCPFPTALFF